MAARSIYPFQILTYVLPVLRFISILFTTNLPNNFALRCCQVVSASSHPTLYLSLSSFMSWLVHYSTSIAEARRRMNLDPGNLEEKQKWEDLVKERSADQKEERNDRSHNSLIGPHCLCWLMHSDLKRRRKILESFSLRSRSNLLL